MNRRARMLGRCGGVAAALLVLAGPAGAEIGVPSPTPEPAPSATAVPTAVATVVATPSTTPTATAAPTPSATATPVVTPTPSPMSTPVPVPVAATPTAATAAAVATPRPAVVVARATPSSVVTPAPMIDPSDVPDAQPCSEAGPNCGVVDAACTILGSPGNDVLVGSPFDDVICGLAGNDVIDGEGGDDVLVGGTGNDTLAGGSGENCLLAGPGDDTLVEPGPDDPIAGAPTGDNPEPVVTPRAVCYRVVARAGGTAGGGGELLVLVARGAAPPVTSPGPVAGPVRTGAFFIAIARLAAATRGGTTHLPVALPSSAVVSDGQIRQLLLCANTVHGRLVYRRHGRRVAGGQFTCTPPSEVVPFRLRDAARSRLEQAGRLAVTARATLGTATYRFRVLLKAA